MGLIILVIAIFLAVLGQCVPELAVANGNNAVPPAFDAIAVPLGTAALGPDVLPESSTRRGLAAGRPRLEH